MPSTAFLLDVIVYGLVAAVVVPVIDLILFSLRSSRVPLDLGFDGQTGSRDDTEPAARRSSGRPGNTRSQMPAGQPADALQKVAIRRRPSMTSAPAASLPAAGARVQARLGDTPRAAGVSSRIPAPAAYVASNGIIVTPSMNIFGEVTAAPAAEPAATSAKPHLAGVAGPAAGHPHAEYWRYGSTHFYESSDRL